MSLAPSFGEVENAKNEPLGANMGAKAAFPLLSNPFRQASTMTILTLFAFFL